MSCPYIVSCNKRMSCPYQVSCNDSLMDCNKDEAEKCMKIAQQYIARGNIEHAERCLLKAERMYPTKKVKDLLIKMRQSPGDSGPGGVDSTHDYPSDQQDISLNQEQMKTLIRLRSDPDILENEITDDDIRRAVFETTSLKNAKRCLMQNCVVCETRHAIYQMEIVPLCHCRMCVEGFNNWIRFRLNENDVRNWYCPGCDGPREDVSKMLEHLGLIQSLIVEKRRELADIRAAVCRTIAALSAELNHENFRWCQTDGCRNGFIYSGVSRKMQCPACQEHTCRDCRKKWLPEHENMSCEQFQAVMRINEGPEMAMLRKESFECPVCRFPYAHGGGCLHMICKKCDPQVHFCIGCMERMYDGSQCVRGNKCKNLGLHAHHPRNCAYYLRDLSDSQMEELLKSNNKPFMPKKKFVEAIYGESSLSDSLRDAANEKYKDYLICLINESNIEPAKVFDDAQCRCIVRRENKWHELEISRESLVTFIEKHIPLKRIKYIPGYELLKKLVIE